MTSAHPAPRRLARGALAACVAASLLVSTVACASRSSENGDVLSQKVAEEGRTQVSVLVKYAFTVNGFEQAVEEQFPDIDIVQVGNYTREMGIDEYEARLEHGDLTDIVMTWPYEVGEQYWDDNLLDLSGMGFSSRYNISALNEIARDGKLYYLPGPAQVRGIVYNKTLFAENGWEVPADFDGFVELCRTIEDSGMRSLQLGLKNAEVLDTAFTGFGFASCYGKPQDERWLEAYDRNDGASFGDQFQPALDAFQTLVDENILQAGDLDVDYAQRETMLFTRGCAMVEDSVLMARMGESQTGTTDEFALMPFFNPGDGGDWARLYPVCYIGLGKQIAQAGNETVYDAVMRIMDYLSTPEGQEALMSDTGAMYSNLTGVGAPDVPEIDDMRNALEHGRYGSFPTLANAQDALREGLAGMVRGDTTSAQVIEMVDAQNAAPQSASNEEEVLGAAASDFTLAETGGFVADALREASGADVALFLDNGKDGRYNGKGISGRLYGGTVTMTDVLRILPDLKHGETGTMWTVSMTGANLLRTLEYALPVDNDQTGWFYYASGLTMTYDPQAEPGSRIEAIARSDGSAIEPDAVYTVAVMDETVPDEYLLSCDRSNRAVADIVAQAVRDAKTVAPAQDGRFIVGERAR